MLNDILAVCVTAAVIGVFATIFGAVELFWRALRAARHVSGL
jgi:Flp pilus assembly pilin Flp